MRAALNGSSSAPTRKRVPQARRPALSVEAQNVRQLRRQLGLTQAALARLLGVHEMTIGRWERDKLRLSSWQHSLVLALLQAQPRPELARALLDPATNPIAFLAVLLGDFLPAQAPRLPVSRSTALPGPAPSSPLGLPPAPLLADPAVGRFSLLEIDDEPDPEGGSRR